MQLLQHSLQALGAAGGWVVGLPWRLRPAASAGNGWMWVEDLWQCPSQSDLPITKNKHWLLSCVLHLAQLEGKYCCGYKLEGIFLKTL